MCADRATCAALVMKFATPRIDVYDLDPLAVESYTESNEHTQYVLRSVAAPGVTWAGFTHSAHVGSTDYIPDGAASPFAVRRHARYSSSSVLHVLDTRALYDAVVVADEAVARDAKTSAQLGQAASATVQRVCGTGDNKCILRPDCRRALGGRACTGRWSGDRYDEYVRLVTQTIPQAELDQVDLVASLPLELKTLYVRGTAGITTFYIGVNPNVRKSPDAAHPPVVVTAKRGGPGAWPLGSRHPARVVLYADTVVEALVYLERYLPVDMADAAHNTLRYAKIKLERERDECPPSDYSLMQKLYAMLSSHDLTDEAVEAAGTGGWGWTVSYGGRLLLLMASGHQSSLFLVQKNSVRYAWTMQTVLKSLTKGLADPYNYQPLAGKLSRLEHYT